MHRWFKVTVATIVVTIPVVVVALLGPAVLRTGVRVPFANPVDFRAFYCAGRVLRHGGDPYRIEPLRACEIEASQTVGLQQLKELVVPAPLPPYALIPFEVASLVPYQYAMSAWFAILVMATVSLTLMLRTLTGLPPLFLALAALIAAPTFLISGQPIPIVVLSIVLAARFLRDGYCLAAALAVSAAMVAPHIALPACVALFICEPRSRLALGLAGSTVALAAIVVGGPHLALEYIIRELPSHARSETHALHIQYSLTTALVAAGLNVDAALRWGAVDYLLTMFVAVFVARRLAGLSGDAAFLALLPPAFIVLGGVYVHESQFLIVLPASMLLLKHFGPHRFPVVAASIALTLAAMLLDTFGSILPRPSNLAIRSQLSSLDTRGLASDSIALWHAYRMPTVTATIEHVIVLKLPALAGLLLLVAAATSTALCRVRSLDATPGASSLR